MTDPTATRYFAASNSSTGFRNYYGDCFSEHRCDRLYIVKGGPGTGKSHFLRTVASRARRLGWQVIEYDCSSDPASLDGVLLRREGHPRIGLLDGTAPHVCEPVTPGVREEIVNLGTFWDASRLRSAGDTVRRLSNGKAAAYRRAYDYLAAAGRLNAVADSLVAPTVRTDRLSALAARILRGVPGGGREAFDATPALRRALSMTGEMTHHTFENHAQSLLTVGNAYGLGFRLTDALLALSRERGHTVLVSYDPVYSDKVDGLLYPETGLAILVDHAEPREDCPTRALSLRRYTDAEALRAVRAEVRHAAALRTELESDALRALAEAATFHFDMETIYAAAMDFPAKEAFTESFCAALFDH